MAREVSHGFFDASAAERETFGWAYDTTAVEPSYNPARANSLLDELGWKREAAEIRKRNGIPLQVILASRSDGLDPNVDVLIQAQLRRVGIDVVIKTYNPALFLGPAKQHGIYRGGNFQMMYIPFYFMGFDGDLSDELTCPEIEPFGDNFSHFCDPRMDKFLDSGISTFDRKTRRRDYAKAQHLFNDLLPWIPMWEIPKIDIYTKRLKNFNPTQAYDSYYRVQDWELDPR
jgi:dipeptide transport system substrate-binding protein